jgi:hypothetical protein
MKHEFNIDYQGTEKKVVIEPAIYQGKPMYEIAYNGQFVVVYKDGEEWYQDGDHDFDKEWLNAVGSTIEKLPKMESNKML